MKSVLCPMPTAAAAARNIPESADGAGSDKNAAMQAQSLSPMRFT